MKTPIIRHALLAITVASCCTVAFAQTPPATDNPADAPPSSQSTPTADPAQPTDAMTPAATPSTTHDPSPAAPTVAPDTTNDPTATPVATDPATTTPTTPVGDQTAVDDDHERHGGFPWGLLGLLGLLGLIPRRPKVDTYTVRDTTTGDATGYDSTRTL